MMIIRVYKFAVVNLIYLKSPTIIRSVYNLINQIIIIINNRKTKTF